MSNLGISGVTAKVPVTYTTSNWLKENTPAEEAKESPAQKAAEQLKANAAKSISHGPNGTGLIINKKG